MRKLQHLLTATVLLTVSSAFSQTLMDYVDEVRGDTLVIKDFRDSNEYNSLNQALTLDTDGVPAGRVYMLKTNGYYPLISNPVTQRPTVIVGEDNTIFVNNHDAGADPPLICGTTAESGMVNTGSIGYMHDLTVKNCRMTPGTAEGDLGWTFFDGQADNVTLTIQNCLLEHTRWIFIEGRNTSGNSYFIKDCYFVNMNGQACRRSGGVMDIFYPGDTLWVENSTHIMGQGMLYKLRDNPFNRVVFNHNTFINISNYVFLDLGYQSAMSVTNNIFVNCNVQPYHKETYEISEHDIDKLPLGLVNVYPDPAVGADTKYLVDKNAVYWDPRLSDIVETLNTDQVNESTSWVSQMITMNQRTRSLFDDDATYPYLTEGTWYEELPGFTDPGDLLTTQVDILKTFSTEAVDSQSIAILPDWRLVSTGENSYVFADWPIPVDLSYDNTVLLQAATGAFPVGDLNWFPALKGQWSAQRDAEYAAIDDYLNSATVPVDEPAGRLPSGFIIYQNHPNPFNPVTTIRYHLPSGTDVRLTVIDILGREVQTLVNGRQSAGMHSVILDGRDLSGGVYFYRIQAGAHHDTKKLMILK